MKNTYNTNASSEGFITVPKALIYGEKYVGLSMHACILYGLMLDRSRLSEKNGWKDENGETYIFFKIEEICKTFPCSNDKAEKTIGELCSRGLIKKKNTGRGKPVMYYIFNPDAFCTAENFDSAQQNFSFPKNRTRRFRQPESNNNNKNNNKESNNYIFCAGGEDIKENIDYDILIQTENKDDVDSIVNIMTETLASKQENIRIGPEVYPRAAVAERLLSVESEHVSYVLETLYSCKTEIRDIRAYILKLLFHAPSTISLYYSARYQRDRNSE